MTSTEQQSDTSDDAETHLQRIVQDTVVALAAKYRTGQTEHGGNLWEKSGMMARLVQEHLDAIVYSHTLNEQLVEVLYLLDIEACGEARRKLRAILETNPVD